MGYDCKALSRARTDATTLTKARRRATVAWLPYVKNRNDCDTPLVHGSIVHSNPDEGTFLFFAYMYVRCLSIVCVDGGFVATYFARSETYRNHTRCLASFNHCHGFSPYRGGVAVDTCNIITLIAK